MTVEFSPNKIKLAMMPTKAYTGKNKINSVKKLFPIGIETKTSWSSHQFVVRLNL